MSIDVFLIEDNKSLRDIMVLSLNMLEEVNLCGHAASGEEALDQMADLSPAVVLVDGSLPGMSGLDFVKKALTLHSGVHYLFFSGRDEPEVVAEALEAGACGYLVKGENSNEILEAIKLSTEGHCYVSPCVPRADRLAHLVS
jgi:DNA-binding NarL/FixJ family response regulator